MPAFHCNLYLYISKTRLQYRVTFAQETLHKGKGYFSALSIRKWDWADWIGCLNKSRRFLNAPLNILVELLGKDEVGGGAGDGDEAADGGRVRDAQRQALADHVVSLGGVQRIPTDFGLLWRSGDADWSLFGNNWDQWFQKSKKQIVQSYCRLAEGLTSGRYPFDSLENSGPKPGFNVRPFNSYSMKNTLLKNALNLPQKNS